MAIREAEARWNGDLKGGTGEVKLEGGLGARYSYASRFETDQGTNTNPEELIGAALASCFAMALSARLGKAGFEVNHVKATARVHLDAVNGGHKLTKIELNTTGDVRDIDDATFKKHAEEAKSTCPIAQVLGGGSAELILASAELAKMTSPQNKPAPPPSESNV
jgi:lipoyl-dependent peroxiredoxin